MALERIPLPRLLFQCPYDRGADYDYPLPLATDVFDKTSPLMQWKQQQQQHILMFERNYQDSSTYCLISNRKTKENMNCLNWNASGHYSTWVGMDID